MVEVRTGNMARAQTRSLVETAHRLAHDHLDRARPAAADDLPGGRSIYPAWCPRLALVPARRAWASPASIGSMPFSNTVSGCFLCLPIPYCSGPGSVGNSKLPIVRASPALVLATSTARIPALLSLASNGLPGFSPYCSWLPIVPGA